MKRIFLFLIVVLGINLSAEKLPDNIYFRAMNDEMQRSKKQLRIKDNAKPLYIGYAVRTTPSQTFSAAMGSLWPYQDPTKSTVNPQVSVYMYSGDVQNNSSGYKPEGGVYVAQVSTQDSYESLRNALWRLSDAEYISSSKLAEEKAAVKQKMQEGNFEPEFSKAPAAHFVEPIASFVPRNPAIYQPLVQALSAEGNKYPYIEMYTASISFSQRNRYFLDSEGNFFQRGIAENIVSFAAEFRNKDGYKINQLRSYPLPIDESKIEAFVREKSAEFLQNVVLSYSAQKAEFYAGPVLLKPAAASFFLSVLFTSNIIQTKATLAPSGYKSINQLVHKINHRIMTPVLEVFDRPMERSFNGFVLRGFTPVDDEGVAPKPLHIIEGGKLKELPTVRSLIKGQKQSNGHALRMGSSYPVAYYTNLFFEPTRPLTATQLEQKLLELCREQELEYCYIIHQGEGVSGLAEKIYVSDGHKEPVYGFTMQISSDQMRPLRDIVAAGDDATLVGSYDRVVPSLLVNDMELLPIEKKPDRKPFVKKP